MQLEILTPERVLFTGEVTSVQLPGSGGLFEILNNHAPIVSSLIPGTIKVKTADGKTETVEITGGGVVEMMGNKIVVLA